MTTDLDFETHHQKYISMYGLNNSDESPGRAEMERLALKNAQHDQALHVFDPLRDWYVNSIQLANKLSTDKARYFMMYGAGRRFGMLFFAYRAIIHSVPPEREEPLSSDESSSLSRDINIIYMNLIGTLDNFAWCLLYENKLTEEDCHKNDVGLFSKKFRKLELFDSVRDVKQFDDWYSDIRDRRDPVAHRIPLSVSPTFVTQEEADRYQRLQQEHLNLVAKLKFEEADNTMKEMNRIGKFGSLFVHHPEEPAIPIYPVVPTDMANLIKIGNIVEKALLA